MHVYATSLSSSCNGRRRSRRSKSKSVEGCAHHRQARVRPESGEHQEQQSELYDGRAESRRPRRASRLSVRRAGCIRRSRRSMACGQSSGGSLGLMTTSALGRICRESRRQSLPPGAGVRQPRAATGCDRQTLPVWRVANACASLCGLMVPWNMMVLRKKQKVHGDMPHLQKNMSNKAGQKNSQEHQRPI